MVERIRRLGVLAVAVGLAAVVSGCGDSSSTPGGSPLASATGSTRNGGTAPTAATSLPSPPGSAPPPTSAGTFPSALASTTVSVPIDPALLEILPATVGGLPVTANPEPAGTDDPGLVDTVERMAQAIVVDPSSDAFAYISVIALQPGVFDEAFYRSWRDSFDDGACSQAGGVGGHAETRIGGRTTYIGRCSGGVTTYHVRLEARDVIVSVSSLGEARLGEQVLAALRP